MHGSGSQMVWRPAASYTVPVRSRLVSRGPTRALVSKFSKPHFSTLLGTSRKAWSSILPTLEILINPSRRDNCGPLRSSNIVHSAHSRLGENRVKIWILAISPLILHLLLVLVLGLFVSIYVDGRVFNVTQRSKTIMISNGSIIHSPYIPLQTDIVTIISSGIAISRARAGWWSTATAWRCSLLLMEKGGISLREMHQIIGLQFLSPPVAGWMRRTSRKHVLGHRTLISLILLLSFPAQLSGPILTGSLIWSASNYNAENATSLNFPNRLLNRGTEYGYARALDRLTGSQEKCILQEYLSLYTDPLERAALKRRISGTKEVPVDSLLYSVVIPYFLIKSIEWVKDPRENLTDE